MNSDLLTTTVIIFAICFLLFIIFSTINLKKEGFDQKFNQKSSNDKINTSTNNSSSTSNGIAGGAESYAANIQSQVIKLQDTILLSKYRSNYENVVIALDDLVDHLMLNTTLTMNPTNPQESLRELVDLNNAKTALNHVMKFIDSN
jgi:hypothetical protein